MTDFREHRYQVLDGLRGVAALLVVVLHLWPFFGAFHFHEAYLAVDFFFALSGFVIAEAYGARLQGRLSFGGFLRLRLARFYPLYLAGTALGVLRVLVVLRGGDNLWHWSGGSLAGALGFALLMLPGPFMQELYPLLPSAWTLFWELVANLGYAAALPRRAPRWALPAFVAVAALTLAALILRSGTITLGNLQGWAHWSLGCARVAFGFSVGVWIHRWDRSRWPDLHPALLTGLLVLLLSLDPGDAGRALYEVLVALLALPALVALGTRSTARAPWQASLAATLGAASYGVYVLHEQLSMVLDGVAKRLLHASLTQWQPYSGFALTAVILAAALWLDAVYDRPVRKWLNGKA